MLSGGLSEDQDSSRAKILAAGLQDARLPHAKLAKQATKQQQRLRAERRDALRQPNSLPSYLSGTPNTLPSYLSGKPNALPSYLSGTPNTLPSYLSGTPNALPSYLSGTPCSAYMLTQKQLRVKDSLLHKGQLQDMSVP